MFEIFESRNINKTLWKNLIQKYLFKCVSTKVKRDQFEEKLIYKKIKIIQ